MPEYININTKTNTYIAGSGLYKPFDKAILTEETAKKDPKTWKLLSEYNKEQELLREKDALKETPEAKIKRLEHELRVANKEKKEGMIEKETGVEKTDPLKEHREKLAKAKELGYKGTGKKEEINAFLEENNGDK